MAYPLYMTPEQFESKAYEIFVQFELRKGTYNRTQLVEEIGFMKDAGLDLTSKMSPSKREELYLTKQRIGASFPIIRKQRRSILMSLENAINHATFSDEMSGNPYKYKVG